MSATKENGWLKPGWINRQFARVEADVKTWPPWMRRETGSKEPMIHSDLNDPPLGGFDSPVVGQQLLEALPFEKRPSTFDELWYSRSVTKKSTVYLCGPISGLSFDECVAYYDQVNQLLPPWIVPISPMRGKGYLKGEPVLGDTYENTVLSSGKAIVTRDYFDVKRADVILANFIGAKRVSIGSLFEIAWAFEMKKPVILAMEPGNLHDHAFVREACGIRAHTLEEAVKALTFVVTPGL